MSTGKGIVSAVVVVGVIWFGYTTFFSKTLGSGKQYLGDPRNACVYPAGSVRGAAIGYTDEEGRPDAFDEFSSLQEAAAAGYRPCSSN